MERLNYSGYESGPESSDDDKEKKKEDKKDKRQEAKKLGALTSFSFEKTEDKPEKKGLDSLFEKKENSKPESNKTKEEDEATTDDEPDNSIEETPVNEASLEALKEQLDENIPRLELEVENSEPGSIEHEDALAALETEKKLKELAEDPATDADEKISEEFDDRIAAIEGDEVATDDNLEEDTPFEVDEAQAFETDSETIDEIEDEDSPQHQTTQPTIPPPPVSPPPPAGGHTSSGSSSTPPQPPRTTPTPPPPPNDPLPPFPGSFNNPPPPRFNANRVPMNPNVMQNLPEERSERSKKAGAFLTGGIVGYAIGRRGGRKRTEAKLQPEINKLQIESEQTKQHLENKEAELSRTIQNKHESEAKSARLLQEFQEEAKAEKPIILPQFEQVTPVEQKTPNEPAIEVPPIEESRPTIIDDATAETPLPLERAETKVIDIFSRSHEKVEKEPEQNLPYAYEIKKAEQLSTPQLLEQADLLYINGVSVKELYNTNRIDRYGLVKIVQESMRGHDIAHTFEKVELGHERQAERAREFRHDDQGLSLPSDDSQKPVVTPTQTTPMQDVVAPKVATTPPPLNLPASADPLSTQPVEQNTAVDDQTPPQNSPSAAPKLITSISLLAIAITVAIILFTFMM